MTRFFSILPISRTALAVCAALVTASLAAGPALAGEFTVTDGKASAEISEVSRIYIDGVLAATIRLNDQTPEKTIRVITPAGRLEHTYTLCGEITIRTPEGRVETHEVNSDGTLHNPDHHHFYALGSDNFTEFFLQDPDDLDAAEHHPGQSNVCATPVS
ncbi:hypothetical protein [Acetobacter malorum]|uniref:hypothetical protein n=1 Tax=Acetobacter malorum TaxID=178901 RepID=UPI0039E82D75